ncbi:hypothetical protein [Vacuolonema iberomarrocanum]|uniref:hypothetical protein n=1 Tax=Vacuolonema iberomarrocanum TaxID=3454632 RepID=UPI001A026C72|nr:hypothetical protein [filamentous cyanobacterium LEGE 07170]
MKQQQLADYLNLIQELLNCPQGEEWICLKRHEDLVDAQFLQVMEQVATQLARQGNRESAIFLHNWAAKLHHILIKDIQPPPPEEDKSEDYLDLIQKLLTCPEGMEEEILQMHQALIGPGLVHKMHEVARQLIPQGEIETAQFLEGLAHQLNQQWLQAHDFQAANLQKAPAHQTAPSPPITSTLATKHSADTVDAPPVMTAPPPPAPAQPTPPPPSSIDSDLSDPWSTSTEKAHEKTTEPRATLPSPPPVLSTQTSPPAPKANVPAVASTVPSPSHEQAGSQAIAAGLNAIAVALQQLTQTLAVPRSPHPLWYLEVLERAYKDNWQLTTEDVEQLIGVKPHCHKDETVYRRGNWCFTKVGKLGGQTAWEVSKETDAEKNRE